MVKRGRPGIKPSIERVIVSRVLENREKPPKEWTPRKALAFEIQQEIARMGEPVPEISTLKKRISDYGHKDENSGTRDKTWCLASLSQYPLPPQAIPIILQIQHNVQSHRSPEVVAKPNAGQLVTGPFTIREAQWVARLKFIEDIVSLEHWAHAYAIAERVSDITGRDFDSSEMDKAILKCIPQVRKMEAHNER